MARIIPATISAGLTFSLPVALSCYPAPAWTLALMLRGPGSIDLAATADGTKHVLAAAADVSATYAPGLYRYTLRAAYNGVVREVETGTIEVLADLAQVSPGDMRSPARIILDNVTAVITKRATQDQQKYKINNRELWRTPIAELLLLRNQYAAIVRAEEAGAKGSNAFGQTIRMRLA